MVEHAVVVVGGGPTGMMLAGELALAGIDVAIVERRLNQDLAGSRAGGLHARTIEIFDQRGIADRFIALGQVIYSASLGGISLDLTDIPSRHNYVLGLWQNHIERILAGWIEELSVPVYRGQEAGSLAQDDSGVTVTLSDGLTLRSDYLVGCDGGRSMVRKAAGIAFPGWGPSISHLIAEVEMTEDPPLGIHHTALGVHSFGKLNYEVRDGKVVFLDGGPIRVMVTEASVDRVAEPTLNDLSKALIAACGTDFGIHNPTWISRFTDASRQADSYRAGRVLLAGDAAHIHYPAGGQGLNIGVQDAVNLGWKLAQVIRQTSPDGLLDTYHAERHPIAARVLRDTMAQVALARQDDRSKALRELTAEMLGWDEPRKRVAGVLSGLGIRYDFGGGHPLIGRRMPDLDVVTNDGETRVFSLLRAAKPVLLNFRSPGEIDIAPWADRVRSLDATFDGAWELPVVGSIAAPSAVLVRPDGYVAWAGEETDASLRAALTTWFGSPQTSETPR